MNFTENDLDKLQPSECNQTLVRALLNVINHDTLGRRVSIALNQRKQGHFDKAMLNISEANRDQVLAIREIQTILDTTKGQGKTTVIFEKFHQKAPFQIGLTQGDGVLDLLNQVRADFNDGLLSQIPDLHENEEAFTSASEELVFFEKRMAGKISENELDVIRGRISGLSDHIYSLKKKLLENINAFIMEKFKTASSDDRLRLVKCLYMLVTSSIGTVCAKSL